MSTLYFAIGAMMNPVSLSGRNLIPLESRPAEILDYKLDWYGQQGWATATPSVGDSFHGVAHLMQDSDMEVLDAIETSYDRHEATCKYYNGETSRCTVYVVSEEKQLKITGAPIIRGSIPKSRYVEIMIEGAIHFSIANEHIEILKNLQTRPRKPMEDWCKWSDMLEVPSELPVIPREEMEKSNNMFAFNRLVFQMSEEMTQTVRDKFAGKELAIAMTQIQYDPKYGVHQSLDTITPEHMALMEDFFTAPERHYQLIIKWVARYQE